MGGDLPGRRGSAVGKTKQYPVLDIVVEPQLVQTWRKSKKSRFPVPLRLCGESYSKINIAAAITVVQRSRLSPTALCVMLAVRTILFDSR